jgi:dynein heavy chain
VRTSALFFCITELSNINEMYQYSLEFFGTLYKNAIADSEPSDVIA